jgi:DNA end-binding protein Ku
MARPYWSGHLQISLVSFGIQLFPATEAKGEIHFHQLNRKTGERVRHQNISGEEGPLDKEEIVKGYEYSKGEYVMIEPEDIENLRIPSRKTLDVTQFVDRDEVDPKFFEKPYFVTPDNPTQAEAFAVVRRAMQTTGKVALGKIAFGGREHLVAIAAPEGDEQLGMMAYTMRYSEELRNPQDYFGDIKRVAIDEDQLTLAKELIKKKTLRAMIDAKVKHAPLPKAGPAPKSPKVVSLMDALRKSVQQDAAPEKDATKTRKPPARSNGETTRASKLSLVNPSRTASAKASKSSKRKTA